MRIARVIGTATATVKAEGLSGQKLLIVDVEDAHGKVLEPSRVAVDTVGAGRGDLCLMAEGSAARLPSAVAGLAVDAALIAILDHVTV